MNYKIIKLHFLNMVHFGKTSLEDVNKTIHADTLFSALCIEAAKKDGTEIDKIVNYARTDRIVFSDLFPYIDDSLYLPKPYLKIANSDGNSALKKAYKKLKYISVDDFDTYLKGKYDVISNSASEYFGIDITKNAVSIRGEEETKPYRVGLFRFEDNSGLYFILGYEDEEAYSLVKNLINALSFSGIGGKRSSGYGRFEFEEEDIPAKLSQRLETVGKKSMLLSVALPKNNELDNAIKGSSYTLIKRSGFVQSSTYANEQQLKNDLFVFDAGSCFDSRFTGDIYDVSTSISRHPVYRYAKPMFMEVDA